MIKIEKSHSLNQKISPGLGIVFVLLLSFIVAWYTVNTGQEIVENAKTSAVFNPNERMKDIAPASSPSLPN